MIELQQQNEFCANWYDEQVIDMLRHLNGWATPYELSAFYYAKTGEIPMSSECVRRHLERLVINGVVKYDRSRSQWSSNLVGRYKLKRGQG